MFGCVATYSLPGSVEIPIENLRNCAFFFRSCPQIRIAIIHIIMPIACEIESSRNVPAMGTAVLASSQPLSVDDPASLEICSTTGITKSPSILIDDIPVHRPDSNTADSGYVSLRNTPTKRHQEPKDKYRGTAKKRIKSFDKEVSDAHRQRFFDLKELFNNDLRRYILKEVGEQDYGTIAWRLKCLGETEEFACPWIVILCGTNVSKIIRRYLKQSYVDDQCRPRDQSHPSFNVQVCPFALKDLASPFVLYSHRETLKLNTLCGTPVFSVDQGKKRYATVGGVIKIEMHGTTRFLGMTAGHVLQSHNAADTTSKTSHAFECSSYNREKAPDSDDDDYRSNTDETRKEELEAVSLKKGEDDDNDDDDDEDEFDLDLEEIEDISKTVKLWEVHRKLEQSGGTPPGFMGMAQYRSSSAALYTHRDLDWMLFDLEHILPNLLETNELPCSAVLHKVSSLKCEDARAGVPVRILTSHGIAAGILQLSACITRQGDEESINTFVVQLAKDNLTGKRSDSNGAPRSVDSLHVGDSGSWVIHQDTSEVIGYVLASDIFRDVYVVPLQSALDDMRLLIGAESCGLFKESDLRNKVSSTSESSMTVDSGYWSRNSPSGAQVDPLPRDSGLWAQNEVEMYPILATPAQNNPTQDDQAKDNPIQATPAQTTSAQASPVQAEKVSRWKRLKEALQSKRRKRKSKTDAFDLVPRQQRDMAVKADEELVSDSRASSPRPEIPSHLIR